VLGDGKPTEGLTPTKLFTFEGDRIEPLVSVPNAARARLSELDTPLPEDKLDGSWPGMRGLCLAAVRGPAVVGVEAAVVGPLRKFHLSEDDCSSFE